MGDELSLLWRLKADNAQAKAVMADTRQAVTALRSSFGSDLKQMQSAAKSALSEIGDNVNAFVGQRIPLIGGTFLRVTSNLKGLNDELKRGGPQTEKLASQIDSLAKSSGKTTTEVARFLTTFTRLEGQAARNDAAFKFFGGSVDLIGNKTAKLLPELEQAGASLAQTTVAAESTGAAMAGMAGPIGIAIVALAAEIAVVVALTKEIFELAKASAEYQGKLFDLSQQTGVAVETLSALEVVARTTGSSIEGLTQSLGIFQKNLEEAVTDRGSKAAIAFHKLGVEATDTETALRQTIASLAKMPEGFQQTALALEVFGRGGKAFLAIAKESNGNIDEITEKLKGLGLVTTDQAKKADEFNDQLVLLQVQLRGLGTEAIPVVLEVLTDLSKLLRDNRDLFVILQNIIKAVAITLRIAFGVIKTEFDKVSFVLQTTAILLERIKAAIEFISGHPLKLPSFDGTTAPQPSAPTAPPTVDTFTEGVKDEIEARKRLQGVLSFAFAERQQQAQDSIALAQRELEAGTRTRQELLDATIAGTRKQTQAQIDALQVERDIKLAEAALEKDDLKKRDQISSAILALDTQIANKRSEQARNEADLRAKARLEERKSELSHLQADLDTLTKLGNERIAVILDLIKREQVAREVGLNEIEKIENAALSARGQLLKRELEIAGVGPDRQGVLDKIKAIETDRTVLERQQAERRKEISRDEFEQKRQILISNIDTLLQVQQIGGEAQIATLEAQAALRIKTEEQAAKEILSIRLALLDSEIEATKSKQSAAAGIADPKARRETQAQITNDLKILNAQREALQAQGNRDIDAGRRQDVENERRYADDLKEIKERIRRTEQEAAEEVIRLMIIHFASRKDLIRARLQQDIADEDARHRQAEETIDNLEQENRESKKTAEEKLEAEQEINLLREAEAERHRLALQAIKEQGKKDEEGESEFGIDLKQFATDTQDSVVKANEILRDSFNQVANAIGAVVEQWVLYGETGPAVMRKILAAALASIAKEAAINAIKQLAVGFALLAVGDPGAGAAFTSAAIWGSVAGVAAVAGRSVAGDLFKPKSAAGGGGSSSGGSGQLNPLTLNRNQPQEQKLIVEFRVNDSEFGRAISAHVVKDFHEAGPIRETIANDGKF